VTKKIHNPIKITDPKVTSSTVMASFETSWPLNAEEVPKWEQCSVEGGWRLLARNCSPDYIMQGTKVR
jgi:hypothetical protein